MAAVAPAANQATDLLQTLSLDSQTKSIGAPEVTKKGGDKASALVPLSERSLTPLLPDFMDPSMCYVLNGYTSPAYYYGAYDGLAKEWEEYSRYINPDEVPPQGVYRDIYHHGYGYAPYGAFAPPGSPVPTVGHDCQLYACQYPYTSPYYPLSIPTTSTFMPTSQPPTSQNKTSTPVASDKPTIAVDATKENSNGISSGNSNGNNGEAQQKPSVENSSISSNGSCGKVTSQGGIPSGYPDSRYTYDGVRSAIPWLDRSVFPNGPHRLTTTCVTSSAYNAGNISPSQNLRSFSPMTQSVHTPRPNCGMGPAAPGLMTLYPNMRMYGQCGNAYRTGLEFSPNGFDSRACRGWLTMDTKYKSHGRSNGFFGYVNGNFDGMGELNKGPRAGRRSQKGIGPNVTIAVKGQNLSSGAKNEDCCAVPERELYNKEDFPDQYVDAKFFVIKSYSEDDVHKSVKYNVWASTASGNKKLDAAYRESKEKAGVCPIFLFFSVNTSGQFVGVAEMVGPVDFNKTVDYWQQCKWTGCFPVKWHIVKDVPNSVLKHILLENNDNKPVTNSRDTQEVKLTQGLQMLKLFKEHVNKTSIMDDFLFYEGRQKIMQERRIKQQHFQKQVWDGKSVDAAGNETVEIAINGKPKLENENPLESATLNKESSQSALLECRQTEENDKSASVGEAPKIAKSATEKMAAANGFVSLAS